MVAGPSIRSSPVPALGTHRKEDGAFRIPILGPDPPPDSSPTKLRPIKAPRIVAVPWRSF